MIDCSGDGPSLTRLIQETRSLATENAKFCEINSKLSDEVKLLKKSESHFQTKLESYKAEIARAKAGTAAANDDLKRSKSHEREIYRKMREMNENFEVEHEKAKILELKVQEQIEVKKEFEERLRLQRADIHQLRQENIELLKAKEASAKENMKLKIDLQELKNQESQKNKILDQTRFEREDLTHQLELTRSELGMTSDRLQNCEEESRVFQDNHSKIMIEIDNLRNRLKDAETLNNEYEAEMTVLKGKLRASQDNVTETNSQLEKVTRQNEEFALRMDEKLNEISKLQTVIEKENMAGLEAQERFEKASETVQKLTLKLNEAEIELDACNKTHLEQVSQLQSQHEKSKTENKHNLNECLAKISNLEIELKEADDINSKKEETIVDQFKKIEELITNEGRIEVELASLRSKGETQHKTIINLENQIAEFKTGSTKQAVVIDEVTAANHILKQKYDKEHKLRRLAEKAGEEIKQKMIELSRTNRIVETQLSELTAESARNLTSASQLKRNHQITINQLEEDHENEIQKLRLEHDSIIRDMETIKVEWEKRARAAEKNLVSLLRETDESQATAKRLKKELKVLRHKNQADELEFLTRIKTQQDDLIFQKSILMTQCQRFDFARLVMRELIVIKREINDRKTGILRFRKAVIVVLAARRLRSRQFERENNEFETMSLMRRIKCGLQNIQYNNEILNLSNSNWLAENLRKAIHEQTEKNYKLNNQVASLKKKLKSSTSFMDELEKRVINIETKS